MPLALLWAGNLAFDTIGRDVRVGSDPISMPRHELAILEHLMRRMGRVVPRTVLEEKLYGWISRSSQMPFRSMSII